MSRRVAVLMAAAGMVVVMLAVAGMAWAAPGPPTVVRTVPPDGATNVATGAHIKAKFSEAMKYRSINTNTFYLLEGHFTYEQLNGCTECTPAPVAAAVRYHGDTKTAILDPTSPLQLNTEYTAVVEGAGDADQQAVTDRELTPLARDYIFYFTTGSGAPCGLC